MREKTEKKIITWDRLLIGSKICIGENLNLGWTLQNFPKHFKLLGPKSAIKALGSGIIYLYFDVFIYRKNLGFVIYHGAHFFKISRDFLMLKGFLKNEKIIWTLKTTEKSSSCWWQTHEARQKSLDTIVRRKLLFLICFDGRNFQRDFASTEVSG